MSRVVTNYDKQLSEHNTAVTSGSSSQPARHAQAQGSSLSLTFVGTRKNSITQSAITLWPPVNMVTYFAIIGEPQYCFM